MTTILTGSGIQIVMAAPGRPMLGAPIPGTVPGSGSGGGTPTTTVLTAIANLTGWWDAGQPAGILSPTSTPLTAFGASAGFVADKSGASAPLTVFHQAGTAGTAPIAAAHLTGLLCGSGRSVVVPPTLPASGQQLPVIDPDQGLISATMPLGSATAWTVYLVWS